MYYFTRKNVMAFHNGITDINKMAYKCALPCDKCTEITLMLFKNVTNTSELKQDIKKGLIEASLLGSRMVLDAFHVLTSINKAVNNQNRGTMATRSIYTEIIYNMSCTKSISGALTTFGIADADTSILAVLLNDKDMNKANALSAKIHGEIAPLKELVNGADQDAIKRIYKLSNEELQNSTLLNLVVGRIAVREIISF